MIFAIEIVSTFYMLEHLPHAFFVVTWGMLFIRQVYLYMHMHIPCICMCICMCMCMHVHVHVHSLRPWPRVRAVAG